MSDDWRAIDVLLENGWPGEFADPARAAYRLLLADFAPGQVVDALKVLARGGGAFRPSVAEIVAAVAADATKPTWPEAYQVIRRYLCVRPDEVAVERAAGVHPRIGAFMRARGVGALRMLPLDDPEYGLLEQRRLRQEWETFDERADEREARGLPLDQAEARKRLAPARMDSTKLLAAAGEPEGEAA